MGRRNPLTDWAQFFLGERYPWRNQARQIWWRSLKGFRGSCRSNFSISHWLCWSSLQHSHTTVWACDNKSQRSTAKHLRCGELLYHSVCWWKKFKNWWTFDEVTGKMVDCFVRPIRTAVLSSKVLSRQISWITCVLRTEAVTNRCYVNKQIKVCLLWTKYQTDVD